MSLCETDKFLRSHGVPSDMYTLGCESDEAFCIVQDSSGWSVFYSERGVRNDLCRYQREEAACNDLIARVLRQLERDAAW